MASTWPQSTGEPLSPWGQRHGLLRETFPHPPMKEDYDDGMGVRHSGFATHYPRRDPKFYAEALTPVDLQFRDGYEVDRLFYTEIRRREEFRGLEEWAMGPLMQYLFFDPGVGVVNGGHWRDRPIAILDQEFLANVASSDVGLLRVDESQWFTFFRRDRWYDTSDISTITGKYSIDRPQLWAALRVSLELANRILNALIIDKHPAMHTLLYGLLTYWKDVCDEKNKEPFPDAKVVLSYDVYKKMCDDKNTDCVLDAVKDIPPMVGRLRLEGLLASQTWGLTKFPGFAGATHPRFKSTITLGVGPLDAMMNNDTTIAERCMLSYEMARTIVHELCHAVMYSRRVEESILNTTPVETQIIPPDPFFNFEAQAEMGYALEQRWFGGVIRNHNNPERPPQGTYQENFPFPRSYKGNASLGYAIPGHPAFGLGATITIHPIPALYASKMLSETFWQDASIARKSDDFFHRHELLSSRSVNEPGRTPRYDNVAVHGNYAVLLAAGQLDQGEEKTIESWNAWKDLWAQIREPWYTQLKSDWNASPWSETVCREWLYEFEDKFNKADEIACSRLALRMIEMVPWNTGARDYRAALPPNRRFEYIFHAIGLLMLSALPIRRQRIVQTTIQPQEIIQLFPTERTPALDPINLIYGSNPVQRVREVGALFDPLAPDLNPTPNPNPNPQPTPIPNHEHAHIFAVLHRLINHMAQTGAPISKAWLTELFRVLLDLEQQRDEMRSQGFGLGSWVARWGFRVPAFEGGGITSWDPDAGQWV